MPLTANSRSPSSRLDPYICPPPAPGARSCSSLARAPSPYPLPAPRTGIAPPPTTPAIGLPLMKPHPPLPHQLPAPLPPGATPPTSSPTELVPLRPTPPRGGIYAPSQLFSQATAPHPSCYPQNASPFLPPLFSRHPLLPFQANLSPQDGLAPSPHFIPISAAAAARSPILICA